MFTYPLLSCFGGLALVLASIGLYGTMSYAVARRTKELGLRIALGARGLDIVRMVLRESLSLVVLGIAFGIPAVAASKRVVASMLFGVKTTDPRDNFHRRSGDAGGALVASYLPALRATKVDPMVALRHE